MPREIPGGGRHRLEDLRVRVAPNLPWAPMPKACTHDLLRCPCGPESLLTQPITPEVPRVR